MYPDTPTKKIKQIITRYNKEHPEDPLPVVTLHGLRHTNATLSITSGTDMKTVSNRLGHFRTSTTMFYAHAMEDADREAAENLSNLLKRKGNQ